MRTRREHRPFPARTLVEPPGHVPDRDQRGGTSSCTGPRDRIRSKIEISSLRSTDRAAWEVLARGYKAFYEYEHTWQRLIGGTELYGLAARLDGTVVGIAHYLFHANVWSAGACNLQDLFVADAARGRARRGR